MMSNSSNKDALNVVLKKDKKLNMQKLPDRILQIIDELIDQYYEDDRYNRPWIIGFSGGKDSTVLLTLVWLALIKIKEDNPNAELKRQVYVVCNDTMVENPVIEEYVTTVLQTIQKAAKEQQLPIIVKTTTPQIEDTFWCCVIGKGYPVPNNSFRFCTERMKIKPTSTFIANQITADGEAIIFIGTRLAESQQRAKSIQKNETKGHRLAKHPLNPNTYIYAPIKELMLEEVWYIINAFPSPWGFDNQILFKIYMDASADDYECPTIVTNDSHRSCGQSRFGCWICTVVKEDKSQNNILYNKLAA
ncbi:MAG: DNA phosphorothioation system sulfurtransferase DndC [Candidatus Symbiothrix sp.]|jgi:DNA sulfur modification protein DndC|nr:DNA phosphorothioation system sulfurtransferase DndC [Candidatus Symbiothrix sp.]